MFNILSKSGLYKNIFTAYLILMLHVVLLAGIGITIILFKGMYQYLPWIMGGFSLLVVATIYIIYQRIKRNSLELKEVLSMPQFQNRAVDVKLLGGIASFKISPENNNHALVDYKGDKRSTTPMIENSAGNEK